MFLSKADQFVLLLFQDIDSLMSEGSKSRTVAATNMNSESSRSHAVFTIILTATLTDAASGVSYHPFPLTTLSLFPDPTYKEPHALAFQGGFIARINLASMTSQTISY